MSVKSFRDDHVWQACFSTPEENQKYKNWKDFFSDPLNHTEKNYVDAITDNGLNLQFVLDHTYELCLLAITQNAWSICCIRDQTTDFFEEIALKAIQGNPHMLQYIKNPTEKMISDAVHIDGSTIQYIKNRKGTFYEDMCLVAVKKCRLALWHISPEIGEIYSTLAYKSIKRYPLSLCHIKIQNVELCMMAVKKLGLALTCVKEQTPEICVAAMEQDPDAKRYVKIDWKLIEDYKKNRLVHFSDVCNDVEEVII